MVKINFKCYLMDNAMTIETDGYKEELIKKIHKQLDYDGLTDVTGWVDSNCPKECRHPGFVRSLCYRMERMGLAQVIPMEEWNRFYVKHTKWQDRHPYRHAFFISFISSFFSLMVGLIVGLSVSFLKDVEQRQTDDIQNHRIEMLEKSKD